MNFHLIVLFEFLAAFHLKLRINFSKEYSVTKFKIILIQNLSLLKNII